MGITWRTRAALLAVGIIAGGAAARGEDGERDVWVNGLRMSAEQILLLEEAFAIRVEDGAYLYDPVSGDFRAVAMSELSDTSREPQHAHAGKRTDEKDTR
jgi:hypothetical protein